MAALLASPCALRPGRDLQPPAPSVQLRLLAAPPPPRAAAARWRCPRPVQVAAAAAERAPSPRRRSGGGGGGGGSGGGGASQGRGRVRRPGAKPDADTQLRLNKAIAAAGVASRRGADDLIFEGKVRVNGAVVTEPGRQVDLRKDKVSVNGREISAAAAQRKFYFALNKPKGFVCSNKSEHEDGGEGRLVVSLFDDWIARWRQRQARLARGGGGGDRGSGGGGATAVPPRLFTVGRLDVQSVGLIFVTNDGDWAHKVMHPSTGITKEYSVTLDRRPRQAELEAMAAGCAMDGVFVQPVAVIRDDTDATKNNRVRVIVSEGRNREVRNLVEHAGLEVKTLRRVRIGGYRLPRDLAFGSFVELRPNEVRRVLDLGADRTA